MELRRHLNTNEKKHIKSGADEEGWRKEFKDTYIETRDYLVHKNVGERIDETLISDLIDDEEELQDEDSYENGVYYNEDGVLAFIDISKFLNYLEHYDTDLCDSELQKDREEIIKRIINDLEEYECYDLWFE